MPVAALRVQTCMSTLCVVMCMIRCLSADLFVLKEDQIASKLSVIVVAIGATQAKVTLAQASMHGVMTPHVPHGCPPAHNHTHAAYAS